MHEGWIAYYWALAKEFGTECLHISRSDMLASILTVYFIFLINHNAIDLRTAIQASIATFITIGILHSFRVPWLLAKRVRAEENALSPWWGILGLVFFAAFCACIIYAAAWFYTMQPPVLLSVGGLDVNNKRIADLEGQVKELRAKLPAEDSLKARALRMADEYEEFWRNRAKRAPTCTQTPQMTPQEQQTVIAPCAKYELESERLYGQTLGPTILGMVYEFRAKGIDVKNIENCAGMGYCGLPLATQLRAFAALLDAKDNVRR